MSLQSICLSFVTRGLAFSTLKSIKVFVTSVGKTRGNQQKINFLIPLRHRNQGENNFMKMGPKIWNSIPMTVTNKTFLQFHNLL